MRLTMSALEQHRHQCEARYWVQQINRRKASGGPVQARDWWEKRKYGDKTAGTRGIRSMRGQAALDRLIAEMERQRGN